jgi:YD repeat-containing protein
LGICIIVAVLFSCKKENEGNGNETEEKVYLPKRIYGTTVSGKAWSGEFEFDAQKRLTKFTAPHKDVVMEVSYPTGTSYLIKFHYVNSEQFWRQEEATVNGNTMQVVEKTYNDAGVQENSSESTFTLENNRAVKEEFSGRTVLYTYDAAGNLIEETEDGEGRTCKYDTHKGILGNVQTPQWIMWDMDTDEIEFFYYFVNNVVEITLPAEKDNKILKYQYSYNADDYPVSIVYTEHDADGMEKSREQATIEYY